MAITLEHVTLSFPALFEPKAFDDSEDPKYQTRIIIPKDSLAFQDITSEYNRVLEEAVAAKKFARASATPLIRPMGTKTGLLVDCDNDPDRYPPEIYQGSYVLNAKSKSRPLVVDRYHSPITAEDEEIYGGVICDVNINIYAYKPAGGGIAVALNGVMKVADGEHIGAGRPSVDEMFGAAASREELYD